jgi:hypothetical protein
MKGAVHKSIKNEHGRSLKIKKPKSIIFKSESHWEKVGHKSDLKTVSSEIGKQKTLESPFSLILVYGPYRTL